MAAELSPELRQALASAPNRPLEVIDPITMKSYVLVSAEAYRHVQALLGDDEDVVRDMSGLLADIAPEDWEDATNYDAPQP